MSPRRRHGGRPPGAPPPTPEGAPEEVAPPEVPSGFAGVAAPSAGDFSFDLDVWPGFVAVVTTYTIGAYQELRMSGAARVAWEEDTFSAKLIALMRGPLQRDPLRMIVQPRCVLYTPAMEEGEESSKTAKILDIQIIVSDWEQYHQRYFAWECKRVAVPEATGTETRYDGLANEYVREGMFRFADEEYSAGLRDAGMLGFVLHGAVPDVVTRINASMVSPRRARPLSEADQLTPGNPVAGFVDVYGSEHARSTGGPIHLHHLFLTFDFAPPPGPAGDAPPGDAAAVAPDLVNPSSNGAHDAAEPLDGVPERTAHSQQH